MSKIPKPTALCHSRTGGNPDNISLDPRIHGDDSRKCHLFRISPVCHGRSGMPGASFGFRVLPRGVSLVEVIVATALLFLAVTGLLTAYSMFIRVGSSTLSTVQATYLLEEGVEAVTSIRDFGWTGNIANLTVGNNYYLSWNGSRWVATSTVSKIDNLYTRYFTLASVTRDANDNIAGSGTTDAGTRKVTVYVSWPSSGTTTSSSLSTYITNLFDN